MEVSTSRRAAQFEPGGFAAPSGWSTHAHRAPLGKNCQSYAILGHVHAGGFDDGESTPVVRERFDDYYARDYRSLVGLAHVLTGNQWAAEDLVQEAMATAHRKWDTISGYEKPDAWVRRVMVNRSTSRFRKLRTETKTLVRLRGLREETITLTDSNNDVWDAVRSLPTKQSHAIALYYWDDMSIAQIAAILDVSTETVKTHLKRARSTLGSVLGDSSEGGDAQ